MTGEQVRRTLAEGGRVYGTLVSPTRNPRWVLVRRLVASFLMCGAIALFAHEKARLAQEAKASANPPSVVRPVGRQSR